ncbi:hypothetical protein KKA27_00430 [Patescibacteria group bacterium]|nr:hypothetical protein [Patescibacteria group bacterium]MBU2633185.1 hypothetical protein [Patescibacteria group bacterium]
MKFYRENNLNSKGGAVSILLSLLVLSGLLIIGSGVSFLMIGQIKMSGEAGRSVVALYAADAGAEECLYQVRTEGVTTGCSGPMQKIETTIIGGIGFEASYEVTYDDSISPIIKSLGQFGDVNRKLELEF